MTNYKKEILTAAQNLVWRLDGPVHYLPNVVLIAIARAESHAIGDQKTVYVQDILMWELQADMLREVESCEKQDVYNFFENVDFNNARLSA